MALNHRLASQIAYRNECKNKPDKTWACVARNKCSVCGEMMEPGSMIARNRENPTLLRHAGC